MHIRLAEYLFYLQKDNMTAATNALDAEPSLYAHLSSIYNEDTATALINTFKLLTIPRADNSVETESNKDRVNTMKSYVDIIMSTNLDTIYNNKTLMTILCLGLLEYYYEIDKDIPNLNDFPIIKIIGYTYLAVKRNCDNVILYNNIIEWLKWYSDQTLICYDNIRDNMATLLNNAISNESKLIA